MGKPVDKVEGMSQDIDLVFRASPQVSDLGKNKRSKAMGCERV